MDIFLWIGSALGAVLGLLHGIHLYRQQAARVSAGGIRGGRAAGLYYGLWAFVLWTAFGSYVLAFWILGSIGYLLAGLIPKRRAA
jgi:hypothetical protein